MRVRLGTPQSSGENKIIVPQRFIDVPKGETEDQRSLREEGASIVADFRNITGYGEVVGSRIIWGSALPVLDDSVEARIYWGPKAKDWPGDWDLASWDAILSASGGAMTQLNGLPLCYGNSERGYKHPGFACWKQSSEASRYQRVVDQLSNGR